MRDYLGERFVDNGASAPPAGGPGPTGLNPRLIEHGIDVTPPTEPLPSATVDRLVLVRLHPGARGRVRVTMRGACAGTMAMLSQTPPFQLPVVGSATTCVDTEASRIVAGVQTLEPDMSIFPTMQLGTFGTGAACASAPPPNSRAACIPGGVFLMGSPAANAIGPPLLGTPQRIAVVDSFWLDRYEVTVAQLRQAIGRGFLEGQIVSAVAHEAPLGQAAPTDADAEDKWCTWSSAPREREEYAINCVAWLRLARPYCQFVGGDLPTEAQWEYAATAAGRQQKTRYPWGDDTPSCNQAVYARSDSTMLYVGGFGGCTPEKGAGSQPVTAAPSDVTPLGVFGMAGGVTEWTRDSTAAYDSACWAAAPLINPSCTDPTLPDRVVRGGSWYFAEYFLNGAVRESADGSVLIKQVGFRCAFPNAPKEP